MPHRKTPSKKKGSASPKTAECTNSGVQEGHRGTTTRKFTRYKATAKWSTSPHAHWRAGHKSRCVRPEESAQLAVGAGKPRREEHGDEGEFHTGLCTRFLRAA